MKLYRISNAYKDIYNVKQRCKNKFLIKEVKSKTRTNT